MAGAGVVVETEAVACWPWSYQIPRVSAVTTIGSREVTHSQYKYQPFCLSPVPMSSPSRPLASTEYHRGYRLVAGHYNNFQMFAELTSAVEMPLLARAVRKLMIDYPMLAANVVFRGENDWEFVVAREPVLVSSAISHSTAPLATSRTGASVPSLLLLEELDTIRFPYNTPAGLLFRVVVHLPTCLLVLFDHIQCDGTNTLAFFDSLIPALDWVEHNPEAYCEQYGTVLEVLFDWKTDLVYVVNPLPPALQDYLPSLELPYDNTPERAYHKRTPPGTSFPGRFPNYPQPAPRFEVLSFTTEETQALVAACRAHGVALTAYITAHHAAVVQKELSQTHPDTYATAMIAVNLKRWIHRMDHSQLAPTDPLWQYIRDKRYHMYGCYAEMMADPLDPLTEFSWDECRRIDANIKTLANNDRLLNKGRAYVELGPREKEEWFSSREGAPRAAAHAVLNLGNASTPNSGRFGLANMVFAHSLLMVATDWVVACVSTPEGGLNLTWEMWARESERYDGCAEAVRKSMLAYV